MKILKLIENLKNTNWSSYKQINIDAKVDLLRENLQLTANEMVNNIRVKDKIKNRKWFDQELYNLKNNKRDSYMKWKNEKTGQNWDDFVDKRNTYNKMIKQKKCDITHKEIIDAGMDQRKIWSCLNKLISNKTNNISDVITFEDGDCHDKLHIAENWLHVIPSNAIESNMKIRDIQSKFNRR